jgi:CelD/BcsL family acetyltransferase involved in cellulose biosynthesis
MKKHIQDFRIESTPSAWTGACAWRIADHRHPKDLPKPARALLAEEGRRRFFNGLSWYEVFCRTCLDDGQEPTFVHLTSSRGQVILPLLTPLGRLGCKLSARPLGEGSAMSMTNYQTAYYGPIADMAPEDLAKALEGLARHLKSRGLNVLEFNHLDRAIAANAALRPAFERAGFKTIDCQEEPIVFERVEGQSYADYMAARSANLRKNIKRRRNKLESFGKLAFVVKRDPAGIEAFIRDYQKVQAASWKPAEVHHDHVPDLIRTAAEHGHLCLGMLYLDDRPVATDLTILCDGHATSKKAHYDQAMRDHHVGDVLTSFMFEHLLDVEGVRGIDLGKTAASYKLKWTRDQRLMSSFVAFNPQTIKGQMLRAAFTSRKLSRSLLSNAKAKAVHLSSAVPGLRQA